MYVTQGAIVIGVIVKIHPPLFQGEWTCICFTDSCYCTLKCTSNCIPPH